MNQNILPYRGVKPQIKDEVYVAPGVFAIGDVTIDTGANIWYNTVLRGDMHPIKIGKYTNIQDNSTVHVMHDYPTIIGDYVTVGHGAVIHGTTIGNNCLIGMGAIILSYSEIGDNCIVAAGSLIPERKKIPPNSLVMGSPAKVVRTLTDEDIQNIRASAMNYYKLAQDYLAKE
ncbi:gamma carbonic anhydrase family protein [Dendrosporobacter sp. 1207_IL3150]|uniref:gamma carbonic anhydrase family protein n=1 Tax=Dendrosporobacter sp. 1207_IL3150 TaxID=3084054 RepID=UPI002FDB8321